MNLRSISSFVCPAVAGCLLLAGQSPAWPADNSLTTTYVPGIVSAVARLNSKTLALVDTWSFRKHVSGNDGIDPNTPFPIGYIRYSFPVVPPTIQVPYPDGTTKVMQIGTSANSGYALVDSTGRRQVQFASLTIGTADIPGNPHSEWTAQTWYRASGDSGATFSNFKQVIASGFSAFHPLAGVNIGTNGYTFPGNSLIIASNQEQDVLLPLEITPLDANGNRVQPPFTVTSYSEIRILRGHWHSDGADLDWEVGQPAQVLMSQSTRGVDETAIVELDANGHCVIVGRGSNEGDPTVVGHYWLFESRDGCRTWVGPGVPLAWDDGSSYYAPAAAPFLYKTGNGRVIFMGANSDTNSNANLPRTRVVAAELDRTRLTLVKRTAVIVDEKDSFDTNSVDLIAANQYHLQGNGTVFYDLTRTDYAYCLPDGNSCRVCSGNPETCQICANALPGCPPFPNNWHLLRYVPQARPEFTIASDPSVGNGIKWPSRPTATKFLVYARNPLKQNFWQLNGEVTGSATTYTLQGLPANNSVTVNVFVVFPDGRVASSNQLTVTLQ